MNYSDLISLAESRGMKLPIFKWDEESLNYFTLCYIQKWLREKYHLYVIVATNSLDNHFPMIEKVDIDGIQLKGPACIKNYSTYGEALEIGIQEALKLVQEIKI